MCEDVFRKLDERAKEIEKRQTLEEFAIHSTNLDEKHTLKIEDNYSSIYKKMGKVYQGLSDLELADLLDYDNLVGRFDGEFD